MQNQVFPENAVIAGVPARQIGTRDNGEANRRNAMFYEANARAYARGVERMDPETVRAIFEEGRLPESRSSEDKSR